MRRGRFYKNTSGMGFNKRQKRRNMDVATIVY